MENIQIEVVQSKGNMMQAGCDFPIKQEGDHFIVRLGFDYEEEIKGSVIILGTTPTENTDERPNSDEVDPVGSSTGSDLGNSIIGNINKDTQGTMQENDLTCVPIMVKPHKCKLCVTSFRRLGDLKIHEIIHTGGEYRENIDERPNLLDEVDPVGPSTRSDLYYAITGDVNKDTQGSPQENDLTCVPKIVKPYKCKYCVTSFRRLGDLKTHERIHTGEKPYNCKFCDMTFCRSSHLRAHERIHTGEKPFKCNYCFKKFRRSGPLKVHERVHTGEKPYKCKLCDKCFTQVYALRDHERIHTGDSPYTCIHCGKSFRQAYMLKRHETIHQHESPLNTNVLVVTAVIDSTMQEI